MTTTKQGSEHQRDRLAHEFTRILRDEWLGAHNWAEMVKANAAETEIGICHSHDYCDANMAMLEAFKIVHGRECETNDDADALLWTDAWNEAKRIWQAGPTPTPTPTGRTDAEIATVREACAYAVECLNALGFVATHEHQDTINWPLADGRRNLMAGTVDGVWGYDVVESHGDVLADEGADKYALPLCATGPMVAKWLYEAWQRLNAAAVMSLAQLCTQYRFHETDTGGGCTALKQEGEVFHWLLTETDDPSAPDVVGAQCCLSLYRNDQDHSDAQVTFICPDVESAMKMAGWFEESQSNAGNASQGIAMQAASKLVAFANRNTRINLTGDLAEAVRLARLTVG